MSISTPFIKRPVATSLLTIALAMAGALAFYFLPVAPLPQVEYPTINVNTNLPGASPDTMASAVTTPLERSRMYDVADSILNQKIAQIRGVGTVNIQGSSRPAVRVLINPNVLTKFDIGWEQILQTLTAANANRPKGQLSDAQQTWQIATT